MKHSTLSLHFLLLCGWLGLIRKEQKFAKVFFLQQNMDRHRNCILRFSVSDVIGLHCVFLARTVRALKNFALQLFRIMARLSPGLRGSVLSDCIPFKYFCFACSQNRTRDGWPGDASASSVVRCPQPQHNDFELRILDWLLNSWSSISGLALM